MASFVLLIKESEDENSIIYKFGPDEQIMGRIEFDKKTEIFNELEPVPDKERSSQFYFKRAVQRLGKCYVHEGGIFPDRTAFQS